MELEERYKKLMFRTSGYGYGLGSAEFTDCSAWGSGRADGFGFDDEPDCSGCGAGTSPGFGAYEFIGLGREFYEREHEVLAQSEPLDEIF